MTKGQRSYFAVPQGHGAKPYRCAITSPATNAMRPRTRARISPAVARRVGGGRLLCAGRTPAEATGEDRAYWMFGGAGAGVQPSTSG